LFQFCGDFEKLSKKTTMNIRYAIAALFLWGLAAFANADFGAEYRGLLSASLRTPTPYYVGNPRVILPKTDTPMQKNRYSSNQSLGPRAYPYGYFGAQTRCYSASHTGCFNSYNQTTFGWGY
jgi:hypothetical protein